MLPQLNQNSNALSAKQASQLALCLSALASEQHSVQTIDITNTGASITLQDSHSVRKLKGINRGVINNNHGRYQMHELNIHGVKVRWTTPFLGIKGVTRRG